MTRAYYMCDHLCPPSNFRGLWWSVRHKKDSKLGAIVRLLSSIFLENSLSYKMPLRFIIGGGFTLLQNAPSCISRTYAISECLIFKDCICKGTYKMQRCFQHHPPRFIKHHHSSLINIDQYRSIQIMHIHASSCRIVLFESAWSFSLCIAAALQRIAWTTSKLQNARLIFISQYEAHHVMLQNATAVFMMG